MHNTGGNGNGNGDNGGQEIHRVMQIHERDPRDPDED
jgi:hypothetical protein